jgi:hypothetical protein
MVYYNDLRTVRIPAGWVQKVKREREWARVGVCEWESRSLALLIRVRFGYARVVGRPVHRPLPRGKRVRRGHRFTLFLIIPQTKTAVSHVFCGIFVVAFTAGTAILTSLI